MPPEIDACLISRPDDASDDDAMYDFISQRRISQKRGEHMYRASTVAVFVCTVLLTAGCETPTTQRYSISAENNMAIKALNAKDLGIGQFSEPASFDPQCRALGPLHIADGLTHAQYIRKAFEDELKIAGAFSSSPRVTLSGKVTKLEFSTTRAVTGGSWTIDLMLASSNGKSLPVSEYYEFNSGFIANEACRNTAEAFTRAVQNLVGKAVRDPAFRGLLQ
jgi:hypothetical protein